MPPVNQNFWRSLDTRGRATAARSDEFPAGLSAWDPVVSRRSFLRFSSATLALLGLSACNRKRLTGEIVPYVRQPDALAAGEYLPFATCQVVEGLATGLVLQSYEGRPIKVEGNGEHPASLGATSAWHQAFVADLLNADRLREPVLAGQAASWEEADGYIEALKKRHAHHGAGLRVLTETSTSPTLHGLLAELKQEFPGMGWVQYDPLYRGNSARGAGLAFGRAFDALYDFSRADLIVSLDADFLARGSTALRYARAFSARRSGRNKNFLWMAECSPTLTGANADARAALAPHALEELARDLSGGDRKKIPGSLRERLARAGKNVAFLAGEEQPAWVHAVCHQLNARHGAVGHTVSYVEPVRAPATDLTTLAQELHAGKVSTLIVIGGNPAYASPASLELAAAFRKAPDSLCLSFEDTETSRACRAVLPLRHPLEAWGDAMAFDGTLTFQQPLTDPLVPSLCPLEFLARLLGRKQSSLEIVRGHWSKTRGNPARWEEALEKGFVAGNRSGVTPAVKAFSPPPPRSAPGELEIVFRPDAGTYDGRFFANAWLQELPRPLTELSWGNAVLVSPATARGLQVENEQVVQVTVNGKILEGPVWIQPGHPEKSATLTFGFGRNPSRFGPVGYNAYSIWEGSGSSAGALRATGKRAELACAQEHAQLDGPSPIRTISVAASEPGSTVASEPSSTVASEPSSTVASEPSSTVASERSSTTTPPPLSLYPDQVPPDSPYQWGMVIDLSRCIGCKACTAACQAENNIPTVGFEGVRRGREMHWIRVDRYFRGSENSPEIFFQPVPCMHCEKAPCEPVCPVGATLHNDEGLNQMIYNRCVGTRYCSNNCPYKVRRFNFFEYNQHRPAVEAVMKNPDVSIRPRGVMEKCTYCVQRIQRAHVTARRENRAIQDGEVITACQAACPTRTIEFGNLRDPHSRVSQWKRKGGHYALLEEQGTRPRTTYLAKVTEGGPRAP